MFSSEAPACVFRLHSRPLGTARRAASAVPHGVRRASAPKEKKRRERESREKKGKGSSGDGEGEEIPGKGSGGGGGASSQPVGKAKRKANFVSWFSDALKSDEGGARARFHRQRDYVAVANVFRARAPTLPSRARTTRR